MTEAEAIAKRIESFGAGRAFTAADFSDVAGRRNAANALGRLHAKGGSRPRHPRRLLRAGAQRAHGHRGAGQRRRGRARRRPCQQVDRRTVRRRGAQCAGPRHAGARKARLRQQRSVQALRVRAVRYRAPAPRQPRPARLLADHLHRRAGPQGARTRERGRRGNRNARAQPHGRAGRRVPGRVGGAHLLGRRRREEDMGGEAWTGSARASTGERRLVFEAAAQRMALAPAVVEKDFWVCYTLDHLFHRSGFAESMVFKGGTSLSKAFGLIERFSEDIDLILDWRLLGYGEDEPWEPRSNSAQGTVQGRQHRAHERLPGRRLCSEAQGHALRVLGTEASVRCSAGEEETVCFDYPRSYELAGTFDTIKLEIGPMAAWSPSEEAAITPYAADVVPFGPELSTTVRTASPERTFWEKATILHRGGQRPRARLCPGATPAITTTCTASATRSCSAAP